MKRQNHFYYPYASVTEKHRPLAKYRALHSDKLTFLALVGAIWATVRTQLAARDAITLLKNAGILEVVTPADVLARYAGPLTDAICRDMADREFLELCDAQAKATGKQR